MFERKRGNMFFSLKFLSPNKFPLEVHGTENWTYTYDTHQIRCTFEKDISIFYKRIRFHPDEDIP